MTEIRITEVANGYQIVDGYEDYQTNTMSKDNIYIACNIEKVSKIIKDLLSRKTVN